MDAGSDFVLTGELRKLSLPERKDSEIELIRIMVYNMDSETDRLVDLCDQEAGIFRR